MWIHKSEDILSSPELAVNSTQTYIFVNFIQMSPNLEFFVIPTTAFSHL